MSTENASPAVTNAAVAELPAIRARSRRDTGATALRPLGPKAAALHARRQRLASTKAAANARSREWPDRTTVASEDGAIAFMLRRLRSGLYVERTQRRPLDSHVVLSMVFESTDAFVRWAEADPVRFDHPVLYSQLRRQGDEVFGAHR